MTSVVFNYVKDGKLRTVVRTVDEASIDELLYKLDQVALT